VPPGAGAVGAGIVGEDALDDDALLAVPGERAGEEGGARLTVLARRDLGVGEARMVVDATWRKCQPAPVLRRLLAPRIRLPTCQKRLSRFVSTWRSSPARSRS
jgi:hypothetical protein